MRKIRKGIMIIGYVLLGLQVYITAHFYSQVWGFIGWAIGAFFFVPFTLLSLFNNLVKGNIGEFVIGVVWLAFIGVLIAQGRD